MTDTAAARGETPAAKGVVLEHVSLDYGAHSSQASLRALDDVSLTIPAGRFVSLIGPSGCGKSTLLRLIAGILEPSEGTITVDGATPVEAQQMRKFGFVFQEPVLLPWRNVRTNVELMLEVVGSDPVQRQRRATELIELVHLSGSEHLRPSQLSGGMRQRVAIARALAIDPPILLMDEPFSAVDEFQREALNAELLRIWGERQNSVIFVTHNIEEAIFLSDTIVVMGAGPGHIADQIRVGLPRPRHSDLRSEPEFLALRRSLREVLVR